MNWRREDIRDSGRLNRFIKETPVAMVNGGRSPFVYRGDRFLGSLSIVVVDPLKVYYVKSFVSAVQIERKAKISEITVKTMGSTALFESVKSPMLA